MRQRRFFPVKVRQTISEFGVVIAILAMVSLDVYFGFETPKLHVPSELRPTRPDRGWLIKGPMTGIQLSIEYITPIRYVSNGAFLDTFTSARRYQS